MLSNLMLMHWSCSFCYFCYWLFA